MTATIAYVRVSTDDQTTEAQRHAINQRFNVNEWFSDEATSGATKALQREGFKALHAYARKETRLSWQPSTAWAGIPSTCWKQ